MPAFMKSGLGYFPGRKRQGFFSRENGYVKKGGGIAMSHLEIQSGDMHILALERVPAGFLLGLIL